MNKTLLPALRRLRLHGLLPAMLGLLSALTAPSAFAQASSYPERPVRLVVPFAAGGAVDIVARVIAQQAALELGQPLVIDNRGGAGGAIGAAAVAKATPDGYTILMGTSSTHGTNSATMKNLPYDPIRDFAPVAELVSMPFILVANPALPVFGVGELLQYARSHPGQLTFASWGQGSSNHLATELFMSMANINMTHIAYKGASPAMMDVISGQVDLTFDTFASSNPYLEGKKVKLLATGGMKRAKDHETTPTIGESGVPGYSAGTWFAIFAPTGTPSAAIARLQAAFTKATENPEVRARFASMGIVPAAAGPEELRKTVVSEIEKWKTVVRDRGLTFE